MLHKILRCTNTGYARYNPAPTDADVVTFAAAIDAVVARFPTDGTITVVDATSTWNPALHTRDNGQHPNDAGKLVIANAVDAAVTALPYRYGMDF